MKIFHLNILYVFGFKTISFILFLRLFLDLDNATHQMDGKEHTVWEGSKFPGHDRLRPLSNLYHQKMIVVVDWKPVLQPELDKISETSLSPSGKYYPNRARFYELPFVDHESYRKNIENQEAGYYTTRDSNFNLPPPVTLEECLQQYFGAEEELDENTW